MLGIIGGTSLFRSNFSHLEKKIVHTPYGTSEVLCADNLLLLMRHQYRMPPHRINYRSHIAALILSGADKIIAIGSTGSLQVAIRPGSLVIPDDYIHLSPAPSVYSHSIGHIKPEFSPELRELLIRTIPDALPGGTYLQTEGPSLETAAEIRFFTSIADIVGMTVANEAIIAREMDIPFAAVCTVDNYANGISDEVITYEQIVASAGKYQDRTDEMVNKIIQANA